MFKHVDLLVNVKPDVRSPIDFTKVTPLENATKLSIFHCIYVKITFNCNCRKIFHGSLRNRQETEQVVYPRKCLAAVKNWQCSP